MVAIADIPRRAFTALECTSAPDSELVDAVAAGDSAAFGELYRRHFPAVLRVCERRVPAAADDVAQAAFLRALDRIDQCRGDRRFGAWVQTIALRMCTDHHRSNARRDDGEWDFDRFAANRLDSSPENAILASEQRRHLAAAVESLPDRQREVLRSRDVDERRPAEIAAALGLSVGAVDSVLLRARRRAAETYRALSADTGAASIGTTTGTAVTSAGALGHTHVLGVVSRLAQAVAGTARELAARVVTSPVGSVLASPRPGISVAAVAVAIGALSGGDATSSAVPGVTPLEVPSVEVTVPVPDDDVVIPTVPVATAPAVPAAPSPPTAPDAPALPEQPQPPDTAELPSAGEAAEDLVTTVETLVDGVAEQVAETILR